MIAEARIIAAIGALALAGAGGWLVRGYIADSAEKAAENAALVEALNQVHDYQTKLAARDTAYHALQRELTALETKNQRILDAQLAENDALRTDLAAARRMQLKGTRCPSGPAATGSAGTAGVDDGVPVELSGETRQLVLDLRESLLLDRAALASCRSYVRELGLYP